MKQLVPKKTPYIRQISPVLSNDGKVRLETFIEKFASAAGNIERKTLQPKPETTEYQLTLERS